MQAICDPTSAEENHSLPLSVGKGKPAHPKPATAPTFRAAVAHVRSNLAVVAILASAAFLWLRTGYDILEARVLNPKVEVRHVEGEAGNLRDDLTKGKSCARTGGRWRCRECVPRGSGDGRRTSCRPLRPRGTCPPFPRQEWDDPPRRRSRFDPSADYAGWFDRSREDDEGGRAAGGVRLGGGPSWTLTPFGIGKTWDVEYEQAACSGGVGECFDLSRCRGGGLLRVYAPPSAAGRVSPRGSLLVAASSAGLSPPSFTLVDDPAKACLVIVTHGMYSSPGHLFNSSHWLVNPGGGAGRNHLIWGATNMFGSDRYPDRINFGLAAVADLALSAGNVRLGFDIPLPLPRVWGRPTPLDDAESNIDLGQPRRWLVSFRGTILNNLQPYYQHRWLAAEFWESDVNSDVFVDVQCKRRGILGGDRVTIKPYDTHNLTYGDILLNSTFGFSPGGSGVSSYRFGEVLSAGSIPVVTGDFIPPFHPEVDWSGCIVRVSEARIVDLPRILRGYSQEEVKQRRRVCRLLLRQFVGEKKSSDGGWRHDDASIFASAMRVMHARILNALHNQEVIDSLNVMSVVR
ncbi:hypothetical protein ACHAWF_015203 [Thalassiosira exigua]